MPNYLVLLHLPAHLDVDPVRVQLGLVVLLLRLLGSPLRVEGHHCDEALLVAAVLPLDVGTHDVAEALEQVDELNHLDLGAQVGHLDGGVAVGAHPFGDGAVLAFDDTVVAILVQLKSDTRLRVMTGLSSSCLLNDPRSLSRPRKPPLFLPLKAGFYLVLPSRSLSLLFSFLRSLMASSSDMLRYLESLAGVCPSIFIIHLPTTSVLIQQWTVQIIPSVPNCSIWAPQLSPKNSLLPSKRRLVAGKSKDLARNPQKARKRRELRCPSVES